jgi:hypothetical protein
MKGTAKEWTDKAEADYSTATRELQAPEPVDIATRLVANLRALLGLST